MEIWGPQGQRRHIVSVGSWLTSYGPIPQLRSGGGRGGFWVEFFFEHEVTGGFFGCPVGS